MVVQRFVLVFECLCLAALAVCVAIGKADGLLVTLPAAPWIAALPAVVALVLIAIARQKEPRFGASFIQISGVALLAISGMHMAAKGGLSLQEPAPVLYYIVIAGAALSSGPPSWIAAFLLLTAGELAGIAVRLFSSSTDITASFSELSNQMLPSLPSVLYLFVTGLVPWLIVHGRVHPLESAEPAESAAVSAPSTPRNSVVPPPPESGFVSTKTQIFTADYVAEIRQSEAADVDDLLASVVYFMSRNFKAYSALGFVYDPVRQVFLLNSFQSKSVHIAKGVAIPSGSGIVGRIATEKRSFMSGDVSLYNAEVHYYTGIESIDSILAVPVISDQHELLGALVLDSKDKNAFRDADKEILKRFSSLAAALITNARIRVFQERAARTFQIFYSASHQFTTALGLDEVFEVLFNTMPMVTSCSRLMAITFNEQNHSGVVRRVVGASPDISEGFEFPINAGLYSFAFQKRKIVTITDFLQYEGKFYRFIPNEARNASIRSLIVFPILDDESRCLGLFSAESSEPNQFVGETEQVMATLLENASVAYTRALLYQRMELLATTDGLTELNNHRHFQELLARELERSRRYDRPLSLLLLDIDHFKTFNDTYGHPVGDLVLKEMAACIRESLRINDIPARYGGEEFTVIIPETPEEGAIVIAERIRSTIEQHIVRSLDRELRVTVSIGCASYPVMTKSQQELIDSADKALYYSKEHGRNQVTIFKAGMGSAK